MAPRVQIVRAAFAAAGFLRSIDAHPCDPEHETHCPTNGPDSLGFCLANVPEADVSDSCKDWMKLHSECSEDFEGKCSESAWSNDADVCIKTWTNRDDLSDKCKTFVPKPEAPKEEKLTPQQEARKAERKRIREEAAARARGETTDSKKKSTKKSKKAAKKAKKQKKDSEEL